jgi:predicted acylesterase/phospholipase RssA
MGRFDFDGVSGTSAGAMNAICLAQGLMSGGRDGAREALARFWHAVAESSPFPSTSNDSSGDPPKMPAALKLMLQWTDYLSPEQLNPLDINPLRDILVEQIDLSACTARTRSGCSSPLPMPIPARYVFFAILNCRLMRSSPRPACQPFTTP